MPHVDLAHAGALRTGMERNDKSCDVPKIGPVDSN